MPILILIAGLFLAPPAAAAGEAGCIYDHSGAAQLLKAGGGSWAPAWKGLPLAEGDRVRTGDKGWCEVLLKDGTFVKLDAGSEALVSELRIS
ncbi:MAG: hypothetical protein NTY45_01690, partial [Elusimicrobia bacterium]|nr:hypothetical protein [Elusimicrobiota bacterium]